MTTSFQSLRELAWWVLPLGALAVILGVEVDWGQRSAPPAPPASPATPAPVLATVLPEYTIPGGPDAHAETVDRTLFNPTRRPAPTPTVEAPKPQMPRGTFALTGTTVVEGKSTAFLRDVKTGRSRRVQEGDTIDGMKVAEVKPDRVKLTMHGESEDVTLKVATNPRPTPQPVVAAAPPAGPAGAPPAPPPGSIPSVAGAPAAPTDAQTLLERRRAARAAQAAAAAAQAAHAAQAAQAGGAPAAPALPGAAPAAGQPGQPGQPDQAGWAAVYRQYQQRSPVPATGR